jgi:hypothetical protein
LIAVQDVVRKNNGEENPFFHESDLSRLCRPARHRVVAGRSKRVAP